MRLNSAIALAKIHFQTIFSIVFFVFIFLNDSFGQGQLFIQGNRDPKFASHVNPFRNTYINPELTSNLHPKFNSQLNPEFSVLLHPNYNPKISPQNNPDLSPIFSMMLNPEFNTDLNPRFKADMYLFDFDFSRDTSANFRLKESDMRPLGVALITENPQVMVFFGLNYDYQGFLVHNGQGGYNMFDKNGNFLDVFLVPNGNKGFNIFEFGSNVWLGFTT